MPSQSRSEDPTPATVVTIRCAVEEDGTVVYVVSDEDSEFARSTLIADALHYASDLLHGPGTGPRGSVWNLMRAVEQTGYNPQGGKTLDLDDDRKICGCTQDDNCPECSE